MALSYAQLKAVWLDAAKGTKYATNAWASLMAAIAEAESAGDPANTNPTDNGGTQTSWGLWQISLGNHNAPSPNWADPTENAKLAIGKLNSQGLGAWGTYKSGAYRAFLSDKTAADVSGLTAGGGSTADNAKLTAATQLQSDCLWPPAARLGLPLGQSITVPCLLTRSEARAVVAVNLMILGGIILGGGIILLVGSTGLKYLAPLAGAIPGAGKVAGLVTRRSQGLAA